jgi:hypothetical protein
MKPLIEKPAPAPDNTQPVRIAPSPARMRTGVFITLLGLFILVVGARPSWFGWDRSSVVGFLQISVFLIGLAFICIGGYVGVGALWKGLPRSIIADIGLRFVATGYVISAFSGMADAFGMGSQPIPAVPYFGQLQATGVVIGEVVIGIGFLMFIPYQASGSK